MVNVRDTQVELRPAYSWDCPECGSENFARAIVPEMTEELRESLLDENGIESWEEGDFLLMPEGVKCGKCGLTFSTLHFKDT